MMARARAYRWKQKPEDGTYATVGELSKAERINESYVTKILRLNLLAPEIVQSALNGRTQLTVQSLSKPISPIWTDHEPDFRKTVSERSGASKITDTLERRRTSPAWKVAGYDSSARRMSYNSHK